MPLISVFTVVVLFFPYLPRSMASTTFPVSEWKGPSLVVTVGKIPDKDSDWLRLGHMVTQYQSAGTIKAS